MTWSWPLFALGIAGGLVGFGIAYVAIATVFAAIALTGRALWSCLGCTIVIILLLASCSALWS